MKRLLILVACSMIAMSAAGQDQKPNHDHDKTEDDGYIEECGGFVEYDTNYNFNEGLTRVVLNGKWGFVNPEGKRVIDCIYDNAEDFSEGLALVELNDRYGFINEKGELVIDCIYDGACNFRDGFAEVALNGKWGFINTEGKRVVDCIYDKRICVTLVFIRI